VLLEVRGMGRMRAWGNRDVQETLIFCIFIIEQLIGFPRKSQGNRGFHSQTSRYQSDRSSTRSCQKPNRSNFFDVLSIWLVGKCRELLRHLLDSPLDLTEIYSECSTSTWYNGPVSCTLRFSFRRILRT
jgi:hypothetical protein